MENNIKVCFPRCGFFQVKEQVMEKIANVSVKSLEDVGSMAALVHIALEDKDDVTPHLEVSYI